ncbi:hypothetical protein IFM89_035086 [Coptis chinensis]|uniref:Calcineurin-like phosphoesterase domain-containing protein n=1 Tax=Coptis chinensis TaxID=261450 RepID=A0A835IHE0_9MAGN|nr:hypothetical protein IFM89_035086 [Coptis chinensis]
MQADNWIDGDTTVVQIGDVLDRGGDELKILYFLENLKREALRHGGSILTMNGNHEVMNIDGDFRTVAPGFVEGGDSVVWSRKFSDQVCDCSALQHVLETIPGAKRMIMGHTIQETRINGVCDNRAIWIDVGMSKGCGDGLSQVLEIDSNSAKKKPNQTVVKHPNSLQISKKKWKPNLTNTWVPLSFDSSWNSP